jgi:hypothetical protein
MPSSKDWKSQGIINLSLPTYIIIKSKVYDAEFSPWLRETENRPLYVLGKESEAKTGFTDRGSKIDLNDLSSLYLKGVPG